LPSNNQRNKREDKRVKLKASIGLLIAASIALITAVAHLSCIFLGAKCYEAQMAPAQIIQSSIEGTLLAPIGTLFISLLFFTCTLFALSGAGYIRKLPLLKTALISISVLCIVRGIITIPLSFIFPEMVTSFSIIAGCIWFFVGGLYFYGYVNLR
jgi:hypothetical protein